MPTSVPGQIWIQVLMDIVYWLERTNQALYIYPNGGAALQA